jgi:SAM-dependent methyltransferase
MSTDEIETGKKLSYLYDNLSRYSFLLNRFRGRNAFIMHKMLQIPEEFQHNYPANEKCFYLDDLVLKESNLPENPLILDAGCGFGGTIFRWYEQKPGLYHGLTLSKYQQRIARKESRRRGIDHFCQFYLQSYSDTIRDQYNGVIAIESLIHSHQLNADINNLCGALLPKGKFMLVDDMAMNDNIRQTSEFKLLKEYWFLADIPSESLYLKLFEKNKLHILSHIDLTPFIQFPAKQVLEDRKRKTSGWSNRIPIRSIRTFLKTHLGGFALQQLYQKGELKYQMMIAEKRD